MGSGKVNRRGQHRKNCLLAFLQKCLNDPTKQNLIRWMNEPEGMFQILWVHGGRSNYQRGTHGCLFDLYRKYRGRNLTSDPKQTFRMALKKSPCIQTDEGASAEDWRPFRIVHKCHPEDITPLEEADAALVPCIQPKDIRKVDHRDIELTGTQLSGIVEDIIEDNKEPFSDLTRNGINQNSFSYSISVEENKTNDTNAKNSQVTVTKNSYDNDANPVDTALICSPIKSEFEHDAQPFPSYPTILNDLKTNYNYNYINNNYYTNSNYNYNQNQNNNYDYNNIYQCNWSVRQVQEVKNFESNQPYNNGEKTVNSCTSLNCQLCFEHTSLNSLTDFNCDQPHNSDHYAINQSSCTYVQHKNGYASSDTAYREKMRQDETQVIKNDESLSHPELYSDCTECCQRDIINNLSSKNDEFWDTIENILEMTPGLNQGEINYSLA